MKLRLNLHNIKSVKQEFFFNMGLELNLQIK